ncbi:MAG: InlB B-repeat-containing protein [Oscillospiraceae bacterium]|nr:InlB B-repeat-containing protein [Oscillospiraceae bacterium]
MKKRLFSTLLICCMLAALFPSHVSARVRYGDWSDWSRNSPPDAPLGCTIETECRDVEDVAAHTEYRYGRWVGATVNWCKEYGESLHGGTYSVEETEWSTVRATNTDTYWLCGHFDWEHPSHIHASGTDHRGYPMWTRYKVDGYSNPDFYWEESRWVDAVTHRECRWRIVYYDYTVCFDANGGSVSPTQKDVTNGQRYGDLPAPNWQYHDFLGWFTDRDGGTQITPDTTVNLSDNQTLYAHWTYVPPTYTVTFDPNGGSGYMSPLKVADNGIFVFPRCGFTPPSTPPNAEFDGWLMNGTVYQVGDTVKLNADAVAVAQWYGLAVKDILPNWNAVTIQLSNAVRKPVSVVVCAYSNDGQMLSCAARTVDSGASVDLSPSTTGAAYLKAFLLSPDTSAPLCDPFRKDF